MLRPENGKNYSQSDHTISNSVAFGLSKKAIDGINECLIAYFYHKVLSVIVMNIY